MPDEDDPMIDDDDDDDEDGKPADGEARPQDRRLAEETTNRILAGFGLLDYSPDRKQQREYEYKPVRSSFFLADVESDAQVFSHQLAMAVDEGDGFPCIASPNSPPIPIDVLDFFRGATYLYRGRLPFPPYPPFNFMLKEFRYLLKDFVAGPKFEIFQVDPFRTVAFFRAHLSDFLASRFSARGPYISKSPGIRFTVATQCPGERVHYSPAYFQKVSTVFGSPTTPVKAWIQPGRYTFSVVGVNGQMRFDPGQYAVPPSKSAHLIV